MSAATFGFGLMCVGIGAVLGGREGRYGAPAGTIAAILGLVIAVVARLNGAAF